MWLKVCCFSRWKAGCGTRGRGELPKREPKVVLKNYEETYGNSPVVISAKYSLNKNMVSVLRWIYIPVQLGWKKTSSTHLSWPPRLPECLSTHFQMTSGKPDRHRLQAGRCFHQLFSIVCTTKGSRFPGQASVPLAVGFQQGAEDKERGKEVALPTCQGQIQVDPAFFKRIMITWGCILIPLSNLRSGLSPSYVYTVYDM
jgi:hypothetical protein